MIYPINKVRIYYCKSKQERQEWIAKLKQATGFRNIYDFYSFKQDLGKGKFGEVKMAVHVKTNQKVAVKVIKKKDVPVQELEL